MPNRKAFSVVGRMLTVLVATIAPAAPVACSAFAGAPRDGTLSGVLSSRAPLPATNAPRGRSTISEIMVGANGTYIAQLLSERDSTLERWPDRLGEPVRVWIDSSSAIGGSQAAYPAAVRAAFAEWAATGIPLEFVYVAAASDADVRVRWATHLDRKTGSTTWRTDQTGWLTSGDIMLATHIGDGHVLDARGMRAIALHEVGHAIGLSHSTDPHDIMASLVRVDGLSIADGNTIRLLYSLTAGRVR